MNNDIYFQSSYTGNIYKVMDRYLLQMSPWKDGENRRIYEYEDDDMKVITYQNACMIVNKQFAETDEEWEHNGKRYKASAIINKTADEQAAFLSLLPSHYIKDTTKILRTLPDNNSFTFEDNNGNAFKMVKHQGKIGYILLINDKNIKRTKLYNMFGQFCKWVGIKDVKPIYCIDDKKYI